MWFTICCRCKLFYQRDGKWNEKGVGFLHLKKPDGKAQLVVRADTNLGILSTWIMCGCTYVTLMTCTFNVVSGKVINLAIKLFSTCTMQFSPSLKMIYNLQVENFFKQQWNTIITNRSFIVCWWKFLIIWFQEIFCWISACHHLFL